MNGSMIEVTEKEVSDNFNFCIQLVERGNTLKIVREQGGNVLMVPVPQYKEAFDLANNPPIPGIPGNLPVDPSEFVDPTATRNYVNDELSKMQTELES